MSCPLCGGSSDSFVAARDRNRESSRDVFRYRRCSVCATVFLSNPPADLGSAYVGDYHGIPTPAELRDRAASERHKVSLLTTLIEPGALIEIGPSFGAFALAAREAGFSVTGIEMDSECCAYLSDTVGVTAIQSTAPEEVLPELAPATAVCMWHVLEHVRQPLQVLGAAAGALKPGGVLALAMPNPESIQFRALKARWAHLDAPRHLFLIPLPVLVSHAAAVGLDCVLHTTNDPFGRHCNRFGWEYALRRRPAAAPSGVWTRRASQVLERVAAPAERRDLRGAAYTVVFRRP